MGKFAIVRDKNKVFGVYHSKCMKGMSVYRKKIINTNKFVQVLGYHNNSKILDDISKNLNLNTPRVNLKMLSESPIESDISTSATGITSTVHTIAVQEIQDSNTDGMLWNVKDFEDMSIIFDNDLMGTIIDGVEISDIIAPDSDNICSNSNAVNVEHASNITNDEILCPEISKHDGTEEEDSKVQIDPDYQPDDKTDSSSASDDHNINSTNSETCSGLSRDASLVLNSSFNVPGNSACDDKNLRAELSKGRKGDGKKNICIFCQEPQSKIARHLQGKHKNEPAVAKLMLLPLKSSERNHEIALLRKKGNFLYNVKENLNKGELIPVRRPRTEAKQSGENFTACPNCAGFYTKNNVRHHYKTCLGRSNSTRDIIAKSRKIMGRIHACASKKMRGEVIPHMYEDDVLRLIRYDFLLITFGNHLSTKYKRKYLITLTRQKLRLLGRFLKTIKQIEPKITDFASVYDPAYYDKMVEATNIVAGLQEDGETYKTPAVAVDLGSHIKKAGLIYIAECIKMHEPEKQKNAENFIKLFNQHFGVNVNKTVIDNQVNNRRKNPVQLPLTDDIKKIYEFLENQIDQNYDTLLDQFSLPAWRNLAEATLLYVQIFNRRRAGELERVHIIDYQSLQRITENDEDYKALSVTNKKSAEEYVRLEIRGKLNRPVPVLLNLKMRKSIDMLLKYRRKAGVSSKNPYVFGIAGKNSENFLRAVKLMREYSTQCGAAHPERLRGTFLRKHVASKCSDYLLSDVQISHLSNFLGHHTNIHKNIYRQPKKTDILEMSKLLERVQGNNKEISNNQTTVRTANVSLTDNDQSQSSIDKSSDAAITSFTLSDHHNRSSFGVYDATTSSFNSSDPSNKFEENHHAIAKTKIAPKRRWTNEEIKSVQKYFRYYLKSKTLPSLKFIKEVKNKKEVLQNRSAPVIKTWIHNQITKMKEKENFFNMMMNKKKKQKSTDKNDSNKELEQSRRKISS